MIYNQITSVTDESWCRDTVTAYDLDSPDEVFKRTTD